MIIAKQHVPNALSLSRIPFLFLVTVLLFVDVPYRYTWALACFVSASLTDFLDGHMARRYKVVSSFGAMFDSLSDKILILGIFISFLALGIYPAWFTFPVLIVLSREFIISGLRMLAAKKQIILHAERGGKIKTAVQMIAVSGTLTSLAIPEWESLALAPWTLQACSWLKAAAEFGFLLSAVLAFTSGYGYCKKYGYLMMNDAKIDGPREPGQEQGEETAASSDRVAVAGASM